MADAFLDWLYLMRPLPNLAFPSYIATQVLSIGGPEMYRLLQLLRLDFKIVRGEARARKVFARICTHEYSAFDQSYGAKVGYIINRCMHTLPHGYAV